MDELFRATGYDPVTREGNYRSFPLGGVEIGLELDATREVLTSHNAVGLVRGTDPSMAGELVVVSAHIDHFGSIHFLEESPLSGVEVVSSLNFEHMDRSGDGTLLATAPEQLLALTEAVADLPEHQRPLTFSHPCRLAESRMDVYVRPCRPPGVAALALCVSVTSACSNPGAGIATEGDWAFITGNTYGQRYSTLDQINAGNFEQLEVVWVWDGSAFPNVNARATPIYVNGKLISVAGERRHVVATDAGTGETLWSWVEPETLRRPPSCMRWMPRRANLSRASEDQSPSKAFPKRARWISSPDFHFITSVSNESTSCSHIKFIRSCT